MSTEYKSIYEFTMNQHVDFPRRPKKNALTEAQYNNAVKQYKVQLKVWDKYVNDLFEYYPPYNPNKGGSRKRKSHTRKLKYDPIIFSFSKDKSC